MLSSSSMRMQLGQEASDSTSRSLKRPAGQGQWCVGVGGRWVPNRQGGERPAAAAVLSYSTQNRWGFMRPQVRDLALQKPSG